MSRALEEDLPLGGVVEAGDAVEDVVLPAPLGPMTAKISPLLTVKPTPSSAVIPPKCRETSCSSRIGVAVAVAETAGAVIVFGPRSPSKAAKVYSIAGLSDKVYVPRRRFGVLLATPPPGWSLRDPVGARSKLRAGDPRFAPPLRLSEFLEASLQGRCLSEVWSDTILNGHMHLPAFEPSRSGVVPGLPGAARALYLLRLCRPLLVLCRATEEAERLHRDLAFFAAALGAAPAGAAPAAREAAARRPGSRPCTRIGAGDAALVVAALGRRPLAGLRRGGADRRGGRRCATGGEIEPEFLAELLAEMGYRRVQVVADAGEFAVRAARIDVFPAAAEHPVRIEHATGRVTALRAFDVGTQRSLPRPTAAAAAAGVGAGGGTFSSFGAAGAPRRRRRGPRAEMAGLPAPDSCWKKSYTRESGRGGAKRGSPAPPRRASADRFGLTAKERRGVRRGARGPRLPPRCCRRGAPRARRRRNARRGRAPARPARAMPGCPSTSSRPGDRCSPRPAGAGARPALRRLLRPRVRLPRADVGRALRPAPPVAHRRPRAGSAR